MKLIGLTGGIGSGKSTVADYLIQKGYPVLDADLVAREIVEPGTETLSILSSAFGNGILNPDGGLNRRALAAIAFSNPENKRLLDGIMHKKIIATLLQKAESMSHKPVVFMDVPLLLETGMDRFVDQVWLVDADDELRINRVMERDGSSREEVEKRIGYQMNRQEKIEKSHLVLNNCCARETLYAQIDRALSKLGETEAE